MSTLTYTHTHCIVDYIIHGKMCPNLHCIWKIGRTQQDNLCHELYFLYSFTVKMTMVQNQKHRIVCKRKKTSADVQLNTHQGHYATRHTAVHYSRTTHTSAPRTQRTLMRRCKLSRRCSSSGLDTTAVNASSLRPRSIVA